MSKYLKQSFRNEIEQLEAENTALRKKVAAIHKVVKRFEKRGRAGLPTWDMYKDIKAALSDAENTPEGDGWIPVSERLPLPEYVWACVDKVILLEAVIYKNEKWEWISGGEIDKELTPTHWRPLPLPPEGGEEGE